MIYAVPYESDVCTPLFTVSKKSSDFLQNAASLWKENCAVNKRLDQVKKQLTQAGKTEMHQRYSENLRPSFVLHETFVLKMLLLLPVAFCC